MRFQLKTLLVFLTIATLFFGLNLRRTVTIGEYHITCPTVGFNNVPPEYAARIPGPTKGMLNFRKKDVLGFDQARIVNTKRGWPLTIQDEHGFLYDVDNERTWYSVRDSQPQSILGRLKYWNLAWNTLIFLLIAVVAHTLINWIPRLLFRNRRQIAT
jgi:hypothetical protein